ncbi:MAG: hypothetical protein C4562_02860 [Actinobacteria bacterium]|nr:MAG: hypothetical protein C4562_02860 [Actinomycetota bacterium]
MTTFNCDNFNKQIAKKTALIIGDIVAADKKAAPAGAVLCAKKITNFKSKVLIIGTLGNDKLGDKLLKELQKTKVDTDNIVINPAIQTRTTDNLSSDSFENPVIEEQLKYLSLKMIPQASTVIISDYAAGGISQNSLNKVVEVCLPLSIPVVIDCSIRLLESPQASCLILTQENAEKLTGIKIINQLSLEKIFGTIFKQTKCPAIIINRPKGIYFFSEDEDVATLAYQEEVPDARQEKTVVLMSLLLALGHSPKQASANMMKLITCLA